MGADISTGTRPVFNDKWLAEPLRQPLTHEASEDVAYTACWKIDDQAHRPGRIGIRPCDPRNQRAATRRPLPNVKIFGEELSFDHLVGCREQRGRDGKANRLSGRDVDNEFELGRKLDGQIGRLCALQDSDHIIGARWWVSRWLMP